MTILGEIRMLVVLAVCREMTVAQPSQEPPWQIELCAETPYEGYLCTADGLTCLAATEEHLENGLVDRPGELVCGDRNAHACYKKMENASCELRQQVSACGEKHATQLLYHTRSSCSSDGRCRDPSMPEFKSQGLCGGKKEGERCEWKELRVECEDTICLGCHNSDNNRTLTHVYVTSWVGTCWQHVSGLTCEDLISDTEEIDAGGLETIHIWVRDARNYTAIIHVLDGAVLAVRIDMMIMMLVVVSFMHASSI